MTEEPIIVRQGVYVMSATQTLNGVCIVIDDENLWDVQTAPDGAITIKIPPNSKWLVVNDTTTKTTDGAQKERVAILRVNGTLGNSTPFVGEANKIEHRIEYTKPAVAGG
jgi:hypothetical protein